MLLAIFKSPAGFIPFMVEDDEYALVPADQSVVPELPLQSVCDIRYDCQFVRNVSSTYDDRPLALTVMTALTVEGSRVPLATMAPVASR